MKQTHFQILFIAFVCISQSILSQHIEKNVISYYAVGNSLDGQPMVGMMNVLRFFPVYAFRNETDTVQVTIYFGSNIFTRYANKFDQGKYWEILLPEFQLGEAIQRIEIETHIRLDDDVRYVSLLKLLSKSKKELTHTRRETQNLKHQFDTLRPQTQKLSDKLDDLEFQVLSLNNDSTGIKKLLQTIKDLHNDVQNEFKQSKQTVSDILEILLKVKDHVSTGQSFEKYVSALSEIHNAILFIDSSINDSLKNKFDDSIFVTLYPNFHKSVLEIFHADSIRLFSIKESIQELTTVLSQLNGALIKDTIQLHDVEEQNKSVSKKIENISKSIMVTDVLQRAEHLLGLIETSLFNSTTYIYEMERDLKNNIMFVDSLIVKRIDTLEYQQSKLEDSIYIKIAKEIEVDITNPDLSGPGVKKSDIKLHIDSSSVQVSILYRNYNQGLRRLLALDPVERMGIFRIRYVPFPITGTTNHPSAHLQKPLSGSSPSVFEVGLSFGDAIIPGDEFIVPEFSWKRLGVAFAITEKLFTEDAQIIGLAFTYDFNSYGSIGAGGNFASTVVHGYYSLGINKKAFEAVIRSIVGLFK